MKLDFTATPGQSLLYKSLPNGEPIRGIVIDNPTGGWLYVVSENQWVTPYTNGWSMPLTYMQSSINIEYRSVGPAGQTSTQQGTTDSPWRLEINSEEVDSSSGGPTNNFIDRFTQVLSANGTAHAPAFIGPGTFTEALPAVPNKRYRILSIESSQNPVTLGGTTGRNSISSITSFYVQWFSGTKTIHNVFISAENRTDFAIYPLGIDLDVNAPLRLKPQGGTIHAFDVIYVVTYQIL